AFLIDEKTKNELLNAEPKVKDVVKPVLRGKDIHRWFYETNNLYLLFIPWHFPLHNLNIRGASKKAEQTFRDEYPVLYNYLFKHKKALLNRNKDETGIRYEWYALQRCAATYYKEFDQEKIFVSEFGYEFCGA